MFCFVLFCFVLFCFVLFCFVLFCFVLFCFILFYFILFYLCKYRLNPLKVLHGLIEPAFPKEELDVAVVGISNWALDAAKMNRAIHLSRPDPDISLQASLLSCPSFSFPTGLRNLLLSGALIIARCRGLAQHREGNPSCV